MEVLLHPAGGGRGRRRPGQARCARRAGRAAAPLLATPAFAHGEHKVASYTWWSAAPSRPMPAWPTASGEDQQQQRTRDRRQEPQGGHHRRRRAEQLALEPLRRRLRRSGRLPRLLHPDDAWRLFLQDHAGLGDTKINKSYTSGKDGFDEVTDPAEVQYPVPEPTGQQVTTRLERETARINAALATERQAAEDEVAGARRMATIGLAWAPSACSWPSGSGSWHYAGGADGGAAPILAGRRRAGGRPGRQAVAGAGRAGCRAGRGVAGGCRDAGGGTRGAARVGPAGGGVARRGATAGRPQLHRTARARPVQHSGARHRRPAGPAGRGGPGGGSPWTSRSASATSPTGPTRSAGGWSPRTTAASPLARSPSGSAWPPPPRPLRPRPPPGRDPVPVRPGRGPLRRAHPPGRGGRHQPGRLRPDASVRGQGPAGRGRRPRRRRRGDPVPGRAGPHRRPLGTLLASSTGQGLARLTVGVVITAAATWFLAAGLGQARATATHGYAGPRARATPAWPRLGPRAWVTPAWPRLGPRAWVTPAWPRLGPRIGRVARRRRGWRWLSTAPLTCGSTPGGWWRSGWPPGSRAAARDGRACGQAVAAARRQPARAVAAPAGRRQLDRRTGLAAGRAAGGSGRTRRPRRCASQAGRPVLGLVAITGLSRALHLAGGWQGLLDTSYGRFLDVKVALFLGLVLLGALNRPDRARPGQERPAPG